MNKTPYGKFSQSPVMDDLRSLAGLKVGTCTMCIKANLSGYSACQTCAEKTDRDIDEWKLNK